MSLHEAEFLTRQFTRFIEHAVCNANLTDIMNESYVVDTHYVFFRKTVLRGDLPRQKLRIQPDTLRMSAGIFISRIDRTRDRLDRIVHHLCTLSLMRPELLEHIMNSLEHGRDHESEQPDTDVCPEHCKLGEVETGKFDKTDHYEKYPARDIDDV